MEVSKESMAAPAAAPGPASTLRLRPLKTNRGGSSEQLEHTVPSTNYLEETWDDEPMTPAGRVFTEMNSTFVCVCILGFKHPIDPLKFKSHVELTLMKHKRFSSRVETRRGKPWWTKVKTNVDNHVFEVDLTEEQKDDKDCVLNYTTDVVLPKPFDESRPLWDMHLVDAKLGEAEGCCIIRIHHALGDGTSLMSLLMACSRSIDKPDMLPSVTAVSQDKKMAARQVVASSFVSRLSSAMWKCLLVFWHSFIEIGKAGATLLWLKDSSTVIKGFAGVEHSARKFRFVTLRAEDFKYVSKTLGVTINDVFMAMAAHGLRQYLEHRAQKGTSEETSGRTETRDTQDKGIGNEGTNPLSKRLEGDSLQQNLDRLRVRAVALVNMRAAPGLQELSEMMKGQSSQARWGNHMGYLLLSLPMKQYNDPLELLRHVKAIGNSKKSSFEGAFSYATGDLIMRLFGQKAAAAVVYKATLQTSISLSNIRGPTEHVMFADNPIAHVIPSVVGHPHVKTEENYSKCKSVERGDLTIEMKYLKGPQEMECISLTLHLQSYNGEIAIVAMSTKDLIPDPEYLLQLCINGLEEMKKAAIKVAPP